MLRYTKCCGFCSKQLSSHLQVFCHEKHYLVQAVCRSIEAKNKKTLMIAFNKVRLRRRSSPQPHYGLSALQQRLQILFRGGDGSNAEILHKVVQHIGRNERRQRGNFPHEALIFRLLIHSISFMKDSSDILQPAEKEGKTPYFNPEAKREEPS